MDTDARARVILELVTDGKGFASDLKGYENDAKSVGAELKRMTDSLNGRQAKIDADMMMSAIKDVGGVAKDTGASFDAMKSSVLGSLVGFVSAQAIIASTEAAFRSLIGGVKEFGELLIRGAQVDDVTGNFKNLTAQAGMLGTTLLTTLRNGTHDTVADFELMKTVNKDLTAGLKLTDAQFGTLTRGAFALAQATGGSVADGLNTMNDAMLTGRTRALALLTGKIDLEAAEKKYAASLGATRENLTDAGKLEAARAAILESVTSATKRLGEQTDGMDELADQAAVSWQNFKDELGRTVATSDVLLTGFTGLREALINTFGGSQQALIKTIAGLVDEAAISVVGFAETGVTSAGFLVKEWVAVEKLYGNLAQIIDGDAVAFEYLAKAAALVEQKLHIPGAADDIKRVDENLTSLMTSMVERGKRLQEDDKAQASVDKTTAGYVQTLEALRQKMAAVADAGRSGTSQVAPGTAGGFGQSSDDLLKQTKAQEKEAEKFAASLRNLTDLIGGGEADSLDGAVRSAIEYYLKFGASQADLARVFGVSEGAIKAVSEELKTQSKLIDIEQAGWKGASEAFKNAITNSFDPKPFAATLEQLDKIEHSVKFGVTSAMKELGTQYPPLDEAAKKIIKDHQEWLKGIESLDQAFGTLASVSGGAFGTIINDVSSVVHGFEQATKAVEQYNDATSDAGRIAALINEASALIGATTPHPDTTIDPNTNRITVHENRAPTVAGGAAAGFAIGSNPGLVVATAGLSPFIGAGIGGLIGWIRSGTAEKEMNKARQSFVDAAGGLDALNKRAHDSGATLDALLAAKTPDAYNKAMTELTNTINKHEAAVKRVGDDVDALTSDWHAAGEYIPSDIQGMVDEMQHMNGLTADQQALLAQMSSAAEPDFAKLTSMASDYGVTLDALGPAFQQANITAKAQQIYKDFDQLQEAGADVGGVLSGMSDEISDLVDQSIKFGTTIPDNMKPLIANLIDAGKLTDDAGNAITDISQIHFGDTPLDRSTSAIVDAVHELRDALLALPDAAATAADGMRRNLQPVVPGGPVGVPRPDPSTGNSLSSASRTNGGQPIHVHVEVQGREIARAMLPHLYTQSRLLGVVG